MDHVGIDVHKRESQVCILTPEGEIDEVRIATTRKRLRAVLGGRPRAKVLIESSTESELVARCLEELGHEVIVADPGFAPMYGMRTRRVKTDVRDCGGPRESTPRWSRMRFATVASAMSDELEPAAAGAGEDVHGEDLLEKVGPWGAVAARRPVGLPRRPVGPRGGRTGRGAGWGRWGLKWRAGGATSVRVELRDMDRSRIGQSRFLTV